MLSYPAKLSNNVIRKFLSLGQLNHREQSDGLKFITNDEKTQLTTY